MSITSLSVSQSFFNSQTDFCPIHPTEPILYICAADACNQRAICKTCRDDHHSQKKLISFQEVKEKRLFHQFEKAAQEEGPENPELILQEVENNFAVLKQELDEACNQLKLSTLEMLHSKLTRTKSWNSMNDEIQAQYEQIFNGTFSPRNVHLENFIKNYVNIVTQLERAEKEPKLLVKTPKCEIDRLVSNMKDVFTKQQKRLLEFQEVKPIPTSTKIDLLSLKKEKTVKTGYTKGVKPTAIVGLDNLSLIAMSGGKDISFWSSTTFERVQTRQDIHSETIMSLTYCPNNKTLLSCAWDKTFKIHSVTRQGIKSLVKLIRLPPVDSSLTAILPIEGKGIMLGGGQGSKLRVWNSKNFKLVNTISLSNGDIGPHMTYCKKENILAVFFYKVGKIGLVSLRTKEVLHMIETKMKAQEIVSEALLYNEKKSWLLASSEFNKVQVWQLKNEGKPKAIKDIEVKGYYFGMVGFEEEGYVVAVNYMKELQVVSLQKGQVLKNVSVGLKNVGSLVHLKNSKKFVVVDSLSDKFCVLGYN